MGASSERYLAEQEAEERLRDAAPELLRRLTDMVKDIQRFGKVKPYTYEMAKSAIVQTTGKQP